MLRLVSDVGGTNSRLALSLDGHLQTDTIRSYPNESFATFEDVANDYLADLSTPTPQEIVVAIAGPVQGSTARLTNRDWHFACRGLEQRFAGARVGLLNDLKALGNALPHLRGAALRPVVESAPNSQRQQALVIGVGTGFNVSPVIGGMDHIVCPDIELGHAHIPVCVYDALRLKLGAEADAYKTIEEVFSGRGFAHLFTVFTGRKDWPPQQILASAEDPDVAGYLDFYASLLGHLARDLLLAYLPTSGIYFAGSVARNVLSTDAIAAFSKVYLVPQQVDPTIKAPVWIIEDDAAALRGCAHFVLAS